MARNTRLNLIEAAQKRFYRDGFRNVGLDQVLADVQISKTAFYKHFESKDDLMLAVLEHFDVWLQQTFRQMIREQGGKTAVEQLRALFDVVEEVIESQDFFGCIFVHAAMEFPTPHDPVHQASARHKQAIEEIIYDLAERIGVCDPESLAQELCMVIEGAYVTRHLTGNPHTIDIARRLAGQIIDRHLDGRKAPVTE